MYIATYVYSTHQLQFKRDTRAHAEVLLVSRGQTLFSCRGIIACSICAPREKGLVRFRGVRFTGLTGTEITIVVVVVN